MKTIFDIIRAARLAAAELPPHLVTTQATNAALRPLADMWDGLATCSSMNGADMCANLADVIANLSAVRRAIIAADDVQIAAALRTFAKTRAIPADVYDLARNHPQATNNDRDAMLRLMHGSPLRGDRDALRDLAATLENSKG